MREKFFLQYFVILLASYLLSNVNCKVNSTQFLQNSTKPISYTLILNASIEDTTFSGIVTIDIEVLQPTRSIILNKQFLKITKLLAFDKCNKKTLQIVMNETIDNSDLYLIGVRNNLVVGCNYELILVFDGTFRFNNTGFFITHYEDGPDLM